MTTQTSALQAAYTEVQELQTMQIVNLSLMTCSCDVHKTSIIVRDKELGIDSYNLVAPIYKIDDEVVGGYLPTRVWNDPIKGIILLYYVSKSLPDNIRPFGKTTYAMIIPIAHSDVIVEYNIEMRVFIDQLQTLDGMYYTVLFGQAVYDQIIL